MGKSLGGTLGFTLTDVHQSGKKFRANIAIELLGKLLERGGVLYCPASQRGQYTPADPDSDTNTDANYLVPINVPNLLIDNKKAMEMAIKILLDDLGPDDVIWNIRKEEKYNSVIYDQKNKELLVDGIVTIPDSAHRHRAYLYVYNWKRDLKTIPNKVIVNENEMSKNEIIRLVENFDLEKMIFVTAHNVDIKQEALLFDQYNTPQKSPSSAQAIKVNPEGTISRRFSTALKRKSIIFSEEEVEMNRTSIARKSRKLVPISTINTAVKKTQAIIKKYENDPVSYEDMVDFVDMFYQHLSSHYPELRPNTSIDIRKNSLENSYIIKPVMFIPLIQIALELWVAYHKASIDWKTDQKLIELIAKLAKDTDSEQEDGKIKSVNLMSKENRNWVGKIVNDQLQISNNRTSQLSAYNYLANEMELAKFINSIA